MLTFGEEELQSLATQHLLHHRAGGCDGFAQFETAGGGTSLELHRGIQVLVVEIEEVVDGGHNLIGGGSKTDGHLVEVLHLHAEDFVGTEEVGKAPQAKVVAERVGLVCVLIGEDTVLAVFCLGFGHFHPHTDGLLLSLCAHCCHHGDGDHN